jgi:hypothetical protein
MNGMKIKLQFFFSLSKKTPIEAAGLGAPVWEQHPQIEDAVSAPLLTPI